MKKYFIATILLMASSWMSCKKFADVGNPPNALTNETVFTSDATATAAMFGIYDRMMSTNGTFASGNTKSVTYLTGLSSDELINMASSPEFRQFNDNALAPNNGYLTLFLWNEVYEYLYSANSIIENVHASGKVSPAVADQLEGEAKFMRAFLHFYLVNLYGDVPLVLTTDRQTNARLERTPVSKVYDQIVADLTSAKTLLSENYVNARNISTAERVRPNKAAATALLSRVNLYTQKWAEAEANATEVIDDPVYQLSPLDEVFLKNSSEAIWQLQPVAPGFNTWEGYNFIQQGGAFNAVLNPSLIASFETGDLRKTHWIAYDSSGDEPYAYPFKYKIQEDETVSEYSMVLRIAEQYLIRAEARIRLGNIAEGIEDLNVIRERANDHSAPPVDQLHPLSLSLTADEAIAAVIHERQSELFTEWGHRWFDLRRYQLIDSVLGAIKGSHWQSTDALFPIPQNERERNPLLTQNAGY